MPLGKRKYLIIAALKSKTNTVLSFERPLCIPVMQRTTLFFYPGKDCIVISLWLKEQHNGHVELS